MKKVFIAISVILTLSIWYYIFSFYPYVQKILNKVEKVNINKGQRKELYKLIVLEKEINLKTMKSNLSVEFLLRKQVFMAVYNELLIESHKRNIYWRLERWLWSYMSYVNFDNKTIISLYLYYRVYPKHANIIEYSETFFGKDINSLSTEELKTIYKMGH